MILHNGRQEQILLVGDLMGPGGNELSRYFHLAQPSIVYTDPPWSPENLKWWMNRVRMGEFAEYSRFIEQLIATIVSARPREVFVEQSVNPEHSSLFRAVAERKIGLPLIESFICLYGSPKRPNVLLHYGRQKLLHDVSGLAGERMTRAVFSGLGSLDSVWIIDPCMGKGMTSRMAHHFGANFVGLELDDRRLEIARLWLVQHGYA